MRRNRGAAATVIVAVLMLAPVAQAAPLDGWVGWWADAWQSVLSVFGADETTAPEPAPEPVPLPVPEQPTTNADSCPTCGESDGEGRPSLDPDG